MFINEIALTQNKCSEVLNFSHQMTAKSILRIIRHFFYNCAKFLPIQYFLWSMFSFSKKILLILTPQIRNSITGLTLFIKTSVFPHLQLNPITFVYDYPSTSGLLSFNKPETVLWTIAKNYYYYYYEL